MACLPTVLNSFIIGICFLLPPSSAATDVVCTLISNSLVSFGLFVAVVGVYSYLLFHSSYSVVTFTC